MLACRGGVVDVETRPAGRTERRRAHALVPAFDHPGVRHVARTVDRNLDHHFAAAFAFVGRDGQVAGRPHRVGQRKGNRDAPLDLAILVLGILPGAAALAEETALTVEDVELTERGDGVMALRLLLTADGESAALEMTVRGA